MGGKVDIVEADDADVARDVEAQVTQGADVVFSAAGLRAQSSQRSRIFPVVSSSICSISTGVRLNVTCTSCCAASAAME